MDHLSEALCHIVQTSHGNLTSQLLASGANINYVDSKGYSPLSYAMESMSSQVNKLLTLQPDITKINWDKIDFVSCFDKNLQIISDILKNEEWIREKYGSKYLCEASKKKRYDIVKFLLDIKVNPNAFYNDINVLFFAISDNDCELMELLLKYDSVDINCVMKSGSTPLIMTSRNSKNKQIIDLLLSCKNIKIDAMDTGNNTALIWAAYHGKDYFVEKLIEMGADHSIKDYTEKKAEDYYPKIAELLKFRNLNPLEEPLWLTDKDGNEYPILIDQKPKPIAKAICNKIYPLINILMVKNNNYYYYEWNEKTNTWCKDIKIYIPENDFEIEIPITEKMHYHLHPINDKCYIKFKSIPLPDGSEKSSTDLYH
jgi:ankyrin repeat protein